MKLAQTWIKTMLHIVMSTDSLSLPRPWFQHKPSENPNMFTKFVETYPYLLEKRLTTRFPNEEVRVSNFAMRASSLAGSFAHRMELFCWMESTVSVIHRGVVDCWPREARDGNPHTSLDEFRTGLIRILEERKRLNASQPLIIVGITPTNAHMLNKYPTINEQICLYNAVLRDVSASDTGISYIDMEKASNDETDDVLHPDGHHLSRIGHAVLTDKLEEVVSEIITK